MLTFLQTVTLLALFVLENSCGLEKPSKVDHRSASDKSSNDAAANSNSDVIKDVPVSPEKVLKPTPTPTPIDNPLQTPTPTPSLRSTSTSTSTSTATPTPTPVPGVPVNTSLPLSDQVLIVYRSDANKTDSLTVAQYYAAKRNVPLTNLCPVDLTGLSPLADAFITYDEYNARVVPPIKLCLEKKDSNNVLLKDKILYIVVTYLMPLKLWYLPTPQWGISIDSYIADLYNEIIVNYPPGSTFARKAWNPYYAFNGSKDMIYPAFKTLRAYRNEATAKHIYSVFRLDGESVAMANSLVDRALYSEANKVSGIGCFDRRYGNDAALDTLPDSNYVSGDWDIRRAAEFVKAAGFNVQEDFVEAEFGTAPAALKCGDDTLNKVLFYTGWYSYGNYNDAFTWSPGSIGFHLDSASFENPRGGGNWSFNAMKKGMAVTSGALGEPYLNYLPHADEIFKDILLGANVGDAILRGTQGLQWQLVNMGDPLYKPRLK